ncbi:MAG: SAM-dependent methyltransferase [Granulicella sp.]
MPLNSDIYLVGLGLYGLRQLTIETAEALRSATALYHFTEKQDELYSFNSRVHDMRSLYHSLSDHPDVYAAIAAKLIDLSKDQHPIAIAFDGNPMLYSSVAWQVAAQGAEANLRVEALAGISTFDVLPIQLGFDPGDLGMQTLESTAMVQYGLELNPYLSTLLLQIGHFNAAPGLPPPPRAEGAYAPLVHHLLRYFPPGHPAIFIQSASSADAPTLTLTTEVATIDEVRDQIQSGMTLYLPRVSMPPVAEVGIHQS